MTSVQCSMRLKKVYPQCSAEVSVRNLRCAYCSEGFSTLVPSCNSELSVKQDRELSLPCVALYLVLHWQYHGVYCVDHLHYIAIRM